MQRMKLLSITTIAVVGLVAGLSAHSNSSGCNTCKDPCPKVNKCGEKKCGGFWSNLNPCRKDKSCAPKPAPCPKPAAPVCEKPPVPVCPKPPVPVCEKPPVPVCEVCEYKGIPVYGPMTCGCGVSIELAGGEDVDFKKVNSKGYYGNKYQFVGSAINGTTVNVLQYGEVVGSINLPEKPEIGYREDFPFNDQGFTVRVRATTAIERGYGFIPGVWGKNVKEMPVYLIDVIKN